MTPSLYQNSPSPARVDAAAVAVGRTEIFMCESTAYQHRRDSTYTVPYVPTIGFCANARPRIRLPRRLHEWGTGKENNSALQLLAPDPCVLTPNFSCPFVSGAGPHSCPGGAASRQANCGEAVLAEANASWPCDGSTRLNREAIAATARGSWSRASASIALTLVE